MEEILANHNVKDSQQLIIFFYASLQQIHKYWKLWLGLCSSSLSLDSEVAILIYNI